MSKRDREHTRQRPEPLPAYEGRPLARALAPEVLGKLSAPHLVAIEDAPPRYREELAHNAAEGGWSVELTKRMARSLLGATPEQAARTIMVGKRPRWWWGTKLPYASRRTPPRAITGVSVSGTAPGARMGGR
jgi:hypothetical protein